MDPVVLCKFNNLADCNKFCYLSVFKIPVTGIPPAPTPIRYSCNSTIGQCKLDPLGTESANSCIETCKCIVPNNCGQLNHTTACNMPINGCSVCDTCCKSFLTNQASCDGCFSAAAPNGCGNQTATPTPVPTPIMYSCNKTTWRCAADPKGSQSPGQCIVSCEPPLASTRVLRD